MKDDFSVSLVFSILNLGPENPSVFFLPLPGSSLPVMKILQSDDSFLDDAKRQSINKPDCIRVAVLALKYLQ